MPISYSVAAVPLDKLATVLLPAHVLSAIDELDVEQVLWQRRYAMNVSQQNAALPAASPASERKLPVVVLGDMMIMPRLRLQPLPGVVRPGRSYRAIESALASNREVLVIFVSEPEIANYKSDEAQLLPTVGVIAQLADVVRQPDDTLQVVLDVTSRAIVTARLQHEPFYWATCIALDDPEIESAEAQTLMVSVKAQATAIVHAMPNLIPEFVAEVIDIMNQIGQPGQLADFINYSPSFKFEDRIVLLNTLDPVERLRKVQRMLGA